MELQVLAVFAAASIVSTAAVTAVVADRFSSRCAGVLTTAAGIMPWIFLASLFWNVRLVWLKWIPFADAVVGISSLSGSFFLFLIAFFLYARSEVSTRRSISGTATVIGMFAGLTYTICICRLLSHME